MKKETVRGNEPIQTECGAPTCERLPDGQYKDHFVLSEEDRKKGFIRPVRTSYKHTVCGVVTHMPQKCAESYAVNPSFYSGTFCCGCGDYFPVGVNGDFIWLDDGTKVGT